MATGRRRMTIGSAKWPRRVLPRCGLPPRWEKAAAVRAGVPGCPLLTTADQRRILRSCPRPNANSHSEWRGHQFPVPHHRRIVASESHRTRATRAADSSLRYLDYLGACKEAMLEAIAGQS